MSVLEATNQCLQALIDCGLQSWVGDTHTATQRVLSEQTNANIMKWKRAVSRLPELKQAKACLNQAAVGVHAELDVGTARHIECQLKVLAPWRKGPFFVGSHQEVYVDTEWRSDYKWQRIEPHVASLKNKLVLDVGGGSGYHAFRMAAKGAHAVFNLEPSELFFYQFHAMRTLMKDAESDCALPHVLPMTLAEASSSAHFDVVFCMGVLYHRADPFGFLQQLKDKLKPGGQLVLETLSVAGCSRTVLVPKDRYAQMNNVYFLPSPSALCLWLEKCGFSGVKVVDESVTQTSEQRQTAWMQFHSLADFLDPHNAELTVEGLPRPVRTTVVAYKP